MSRIMKKKQKRQAKLTGLRYVKNRSTLTYISKMCIWDLVAVSIGNTITKITYENNWDVYIHASRAFKGIIGHRSIHL